MHNKAVEVVVAALGGEKLHSEENMLLRFGVSNYRSIKEYQQLSLTASSLKDRPAFTIASPVFNEKILPAIGIYGANASGKSNILRAFKFMVTGILESHSRGAASGGFLRYPFKLSKGFIEEATRFDCDFILDGVRHSYGYAINDQRIVEEWLYVFPSGRRQVWFHRNIEEKKEFFFSDKYLKGKNRVIEELTRPNSLFLSSAAQNNHEKILPIYEYFQNNFLFRLNQMSAASINVDEFLDDKEIQKWVLDFMSFADTGISDMRIFEEDVPEGVLPFMKEFRSLLARFIKENDEELDADTPLPTPKDKMKVLKFGHSVDGGETIFLDLEEESRGTLALLSMLGPIFNALKKGLVIFIDELDTSMHSLLSKKIMDLFTSSKFNKCGAQLVFTTHDTNLLCNNSMRRDEVWFTEKDKGGATHLYPLTDISTRNTDNFEKGYLQGRFGAIPFLGGFDDFVNSSKGCP